ncbi:hypothetical protein [Erwinia sp. S59]|uniref:hypothetical protein n=1 Tax=Erwinia sp. S59 TaxID=2769340 RepID=UPI00190BD290|nr:hypothetical protein [Erwinia sp. S59]MBK0091791.1 hypothetical protein [Erwinia sp. S59]
MMGFSGLHGMPQAALMLLTLFFILFLALLRAYWYWRNLHHPTRSTPESCHK